MALRKRLRSLFGDPILAAAVIGLTLYGIFMVYSAGRLDVPKPGVGGAWRAQVMWFVVSLVGMLVVTRVQVRWIEWLALPLYIIGLISLAATLVIGTGAGTAEGTKSWLQFGGFRV